jgi:hypothetical protein
VAGVVVELVERDQDPLQLVVGEQIGLVLDRGVRAGRKQVLRREPPVELDAHRQPGQRVGGAAGEAPAPQPGRR